MPETTGNRLRGRVIASFGRRHSVEAAEGEVVRCVRRGRQQDVACGDVVDFTLTGRHEGVIDSVLPRSSLLYRSDAFREKILAANAALAVVVVAGRPQFRENLLARCLAAASAAGMDSLVVCNKQDLPESVAVLKELEYYRGLGVEVMGLSARASVDALAARLSGVDAILVGESGMGKSTLINALVPAAALRTGELSAGSDTGRHTTTSARRFATAGGGSVIDSPGMQVFGLQHLDQHELETAFAEFAPLAGTCRFADCRHALEPGCSLKALAAKDARAAKRLAWLREILVENQRVAHWERPGAH